jgi:hypothetical protein
MPILCRRSWMGEEIDVANRALTAMESASQCSLVHHGLASEARSKVWAIRSPQSQAAPKISCLFLFLRSLRPTGNASRSDAGVVFAAILDFVFAVSNTVPHSLNRIRQ